MQYWKEDEPLIRLEEQICKRLKHTGKLFVFLRQHRHHIMNEEICTDLNNMYHDHPRGKSAVAPALLAMATLLQCYEQQSDASAVLESVFDKRWQMVLGCLNEDEPPFSQGTLCDFRHRLIKYDMDKKLLERTVQVAKDYGGFCFKQLRVALDSAPLQGAGKVEDTFNLVGHALELVVDSISLITGNTVEKIRTLVGTQIIGKSSIKAALDIDWTNPKEKTNALNLLLEDVDKVHHWLNSQSTKLTESSALRKSLKLLSTVLEQNIEPDPGGGSRVKREVVPNRLISISDQEMKHGRKSSSRTINGYKQHVAVELTSRLILATCVRSANEPEYHASIYLKPEIVSWGEIKELQIDRGYLSSELTNELYASGQRIVAKPWGQPNQGKFSKRDFTINLPLSQVTCPEGYSAKIQGKKQQYVRFDADLCHSCTQRTQCTDSKTGRTMAIHEHEAMMIDLRQYTHTAEGRAIARERVKVEHSLASICNRKGHRARYKGRRKNEFDLNRTAAISNLHIAMGLVA